jgi:hypothetical protein
LRTAVFPERFGGMPNKCIYLLSNYWMGLAFQEVSLKSQALLRQWLLKASAGPDRL